MWATTRLFAHFRDSRFKVENREIPAETTVGEIVDSLDIEKVPVANSSIFMLLIRRLQHDRQKTMRSLIKLHESNRKHSI